MKAIIMEGFGGPEVLQYTDFALFGPKTCLRRRLFTEHQRALVAKLQTHANRDVDSIDRPMHSSQHGDDAQNQQSDTGDRY